uniref:Protein krueppel n=1 Tax=Anopheles quadriannulatus TaxID=34691 RepID=A0A1I8JWA2_ANOQN
MDLKDESQIEFTITSFTTCCRLCLSCSESEDYYDIYLSSIASHSETTFVEAIQKITNVELISNSKLPSKICRHCAARIDDAFCFVRDFHRTNEMLQNYLDNEECDKEEAEEIDLTTVQELCELDLTDQQIVTDEENENEQREGSEEPENPDDEQLVHQRHDTSEQPSGTNRGLTAVDFILQQITTSPQKKKRRPDKSALKHQCNECDKSFLRRSNLVDHLRLHAKLKVFACDFCDKRFVQSGNLKSHMRTHTAERPYRCSVCQKGFTQSSALKTHMLAHTNTKPFACDVCDKAFVSSSDLCKHKLTHSAQKRYRCVICPERFFTQKVHLRNHLTRMHPTTNISVSLEAGVVK